MSKFLIECPSCGTFQEAKTGLFSKKEIKCTCGNVIFIKTDRFTTKTCPHCGNVAVYDQAKGDKMECPVCKEPLVPKGSLSQLVKFHCPTCLCELQADKSAATYVCPLCETAIDVQKEVKKEEARKSNNASVIKYEGGNDILVWKHPIEDFTLGSQLIVHESQEAIFFRDGEALDSFGPGRFTLTTEKLPLLNDLYKLPLDNNVVFHSEVYFVNLVTSLGIKWGTDSKVRLFDPISGLHVEIGACGEFAIKVSDPRKLLIKVVGTTSGLSISNILNANERSLTGIFRGIIVSEVKSVLANEIKKNQINILEVDAHVKELGEILKNNINKTLAEYGLTLPEFVITSIITPDDDPNFRRMKEQYAEQYLLVREEKIKKDVAEAAQERKIVEAQTSAKEQIIAAQGSAEAYRLQAEAEAQEMRMKGYTYQQETQRQVGITAMEHLPQGGGAGQATGIVGDIVGLGVTMGAVGSVMGMTKDVIAPITKDATNIMNPNTNQNTWTCPNCKTTNISSLFCPNCGTKKAIEESWICPNCHISTTTLFCPNCGTKKQEMNESVCPNCGTKTNSLFCPNCGTKIIKKETWTCPECNTKDIESDFCPNCGKKRGE